MGFLLHFKLEDLLTGRCYKVISLICAGTTDTGPLRLQLLLIFPRLLSSEQPFRLFVLVAGLVWVLVFFTSIFSLPISKLDKFCNRFSRFTFNHVMTILTIIYWRNSFLDFLILITSSGRYHYRSHHTAWSGVHRTFIDRTVSHRHHTLSYVPFRTYQNDVKLEIDKLTIHLYESRCDYTLGENRQANVTVADKLIVTDMLVIRIATWFAVEK